MLLKKIREIIKDWNKIKTILNNRMVFILGYLWYKKQAYTIYTNDGISIHVRKSQKDVSDIDIVKEVFIDNEYWAIDIIIKENMKIIDIWSNIWCFALKYSKMVKQGHIYCFEPIKENFVCLKKNISLNAYTNITIYNQAITDKKWDVDIFLSQDNVWWHSVFWSQKGSVEKVRSTTLERFLQESNVDVLDILKIDCEWSEYKILLSCPSDLFKKINHIIMEQHITPETELYYDKNSIISHLKKNWFKVNVLKETYYEGEWLFYMIYAKNKKI